MNYKRQESNRKSRIAVSPLESRQALAREKSRRKPKADRV